MTRASRVLASVAKRIRHSLCARTWIKCGCIRRFKPRSPLIAGQPGPYCICQSTDGASMHEGLATVKSSSNSIRGLTLDHLEQNAVRRFPCHDIRAIIRGESNRANSEVLIVDDVDRLILRALQNDGRSSFTQIAASAGVSEATVRARYRGLTEQGIVRTVGVVDPCALGFQAPAIIGISVEPGRGDAVARAIASLPEVSYVVLTLGSFNLVVEVFCRDLPHLAHVVTEEIELIPGVLRAEALTIARSYKLAYRWSLATEPEVDAVGRAVGQEGSESGRRGDGELYRHPAGGQERLGAAGAVDP